MPKPTKQTYRLRVEDTVFDAVHIHSKAHKLDLVIFTAIDGQGRPVDNVETFIEDNTLRWRIGINVATHNEGYDRVTQFPQSGVVSIQGWAPRKNSWDPSVAVVMDSEGFIRDVDIMAPLRLHEAKRLVEVRRRLNRGERIEI